MSRRPIPQDEKIRLLRAAGWYRFSRDRVTCDKIVHVVQWGHPPFVPGYNQGGGITLATAWRAYLKYVGHPDEPAELTNDG